MRKVRCYECGKTYDFDQDDFCPKCGAFNQPSRKTRIGADGSVVRVDGINERNHQNSFVHRELHQEDRKRRRTGLEQKQKPTTQQLRSKEFWAEKKKAQSDRISGLKTIYFILAVIILVRIVFNLLLRM